MPSIDTAAEQYLHVPSRVECLISTDGHLSAVSSLSRALWLLLQSEDYPLFSDPRDRAAAVALASEIADHASAAEVALAVERAALADRRSPSA